MCKVILRDFNKSRLFIEILHADFLQVEFLLELTSDLLRCMFANLLKCMVLYHLDYTKNYG
jgi:hypothetical protein